MQEKRTIKRSLSVRNEHHELALNAKMATWIIFQQPVNGCMGVSRQKSVNCLCCLYACILKTTNV